MRDIPSVTGAACMELDHLLAVVHADMDPLTTTATERELLRRLEEAADRLADVTAYADALDDSGLSADDVTAIAGASDADPEDMAAMLAILKDHGIYTAAQLRTVLAKISTQP